MSAGRRDAAQPAYDTGLPLAAAQSKKRAHSAILAVRSSALSCANALSAAAEPSAWLCTNSCLNIQAQVWRTPLRGCERLGWLGGGAARHLARKCTCTADHTPQHIAEQSRAVQKRSGTAGHRAAPAANSWKRRRSAASSPAVWASRGPTG